MQAILAQVDYDPELSADELICSSVFSLLHDLHPGLPLHISPAGPVPLQRVVLMSTEANDSDGAAEFLGSVACSGGLLVGSADFVVLDTVPFVQGTIEASTDVFVLPADANFLSTARAQNIHGYLQQFEEESVAAKSPVVLSPHLHHLAHKSRTLSAALLPIPVGHGDARDPSIEAGVTFATLKRLAVVSGSWVLLNHGSISRLARLFPLTQPQHTEDAVELQRLLLYLPVPVPVRSLLNQPYPTLEHNRLYLPTTLAAALGLSLADLAAGTADITVSSPHTLFEEFSAVPRPPSVPFAPIPVASEIHIARLKGSGSGRASYAAPCRAYFSSPRLVWLDAVLPISSPTSLISELLSEFEGKDRRMETLAELAGPTYTPPARAEVVQFRVVASVPPAPYLVVDPAITKVIQKGAVNSAGVPRARRRSRPQLAETLVLLGAALRGGLPGRVLVEGRGLGTLRQAAEALGLAVVRIDCRQLAGSEATAQQNIAYTVREAAEVAPALLILEDVQSLDPPPQGAEKREGRAAEALRRALADAPHLLVAATTPALADLDPGLRSVFLHELRFPPPDLAARQAWIAGRQAVSLLSSSLDISRIAQRTAGLTQPQLRALLAQATDRAYTAALPHLGTAGHARPHLASLVTLGSADVDAVLDAQQSSKRSTKIPSVKWEDIGGLAHVKDVILEVIQLPLQRPELFQDGRRRSGILLYGPPGTGKTLVAKAVATECSLNFLNVKGPELINMYVGESERNVRDIFARARAARPCVIFFDELDSLAPARGAGADSGGVMDRVVSQLLAELDGMPCLTSGMESNSDVFVIGATNRPDLLDKALLRGGRFDRLLYLGLAEDHAAQQRILEAVTRRFVLTPEVSLAAVAAACPMNLSGADFYALAADAYLQAIKSAIAAGASEVAVAQEHLLAALAALQPSVSMEELHRYQQIRASFEASQEP